MRILIVSPQLPYPLIDGAKKGVFYPMKYLAARGHRIHLACLMERYDALAVKEMEKYSTLDVVVSPKKPTMAGAVRALFSSTPYDLSRFHHAGLLAKIRTAMTKEQFDVVQVEGIHAAFYGLTIRETHDIPIVLRVHNVQWINLERMIRQYRNPFVSMYLRYETAKVRRYESRESEKFDRNLTVSQHDTDIVLAHNPQTRCTVVPAGVDIAEFNQDGGVQTDRSILWMGGLQWVPNQDSFWWFFNEIVPVIVQKIPDVLVNVVGSNPPETILRIRHPNVRVLGFVKDVRECIRQSQVCVVPLRVGSGIRLKLLEMFAMKKAVVSTSVGCEGLGVKNEEHLLVADDSHGFAEAVIRLLGDAVLRERLGSNSRLHVREHFSWEKIAAQYENAYVEVIREHGAQRH